MFWGLLEIKISQDFKLFVEGKEIIVCSLSCPGWKKGLNQELLEKVCVYWCVLIILLTFTG